MKFHLRTGCTVLLLAVLVTPSFSGLKDKGLKVQTVPVEGLNVGDGVVLAQEGTYALVARRNPTKLGLDELITLENKSTVLDNHNLLVFDSRNLNESRQISLGEVYFPELFFDPASSLAYFLGTDFVKREAQGGDEIAPIDVMGYMVLSLDIEKPNAGSQVVRIEIPEKDDPSTFEVSPTIALIGDHTIAFTKGSNLFIYDMVDGTLAAYNLGSAAGTLAIVGSHQKAGVLAIANQILVAGGEGKAESHKTELKFVRLEKDGTIAPMRTFSSEGICLVPGSTVVFQEDADGNPYAGYCVDNLGNMLELALNGDEVGIAKQLTQFSGLAQDPSQPYETLSPRFLQFDSSGNFVVVRPGRELLIRRPAFGRPTRTGIRRPAFVTTQERVGLSLGRLTKNKRGESKVLIVGDMSSAIGDDISALVPRTEGASGWLIVGATGNVFSLAFAAEGSSAELRYEGYIGSGVVSGATGGDQLAAIRASTPGTSTESAIPESSSLVFARMKRDKGDSVASAVALSVAEARASYASPSTKSVPPSIRRPCNIGR